MAGVAALVVVLVIAGLVGWRVRGDDPYVVAGGSSAALRPQPAGASRALVALVSALGDGDAAGAAATGDDTSSGLLDEVAANARALHVVDLDLRYVDDVGAMGSDGSWQAAVDATWRFGGFDREPVHEEVQVGFRPVGDRVAIVSLGGGDRRTPLWLTGALQVRRSATTLVLVDGTPAEADLLAGRAEAAVPVVRRVLPSWPGGLVLEVPASVEQLERALDADSGSLTNVAAITAAVDGSSTPGSPVHVFVNTSVYDTLDPVGAQVVISHESTHVATDAPLHSLPVWLTEGFADYVALRDVDLPITTTAGQVIAEVRADGPPAALPDQSDFDEASSGFGAAYEAAWMACRVVAEQAGEPALVALYESVSGGADLATALPATTGLTVAELTRAWRARLSGLARDAGGGSPVASPAPAR